MPMKKQIITFTMILLLTLIVNIGDLKCQENSMRLNTQYYSENIEKSPKEINNDDNDIDDKNINVRILEFIIKHNINQRYQKLYSEEIEDMLERRR
jgi:cell division protein FtsL